MNQHSVTSQAVTADPHLAETLLQCSLDCVKLLDGDARVLFFNENGLSAMEIDNFDSVRGVYWPALWPKSGRPVLERALADARANGSANFVADCPTAKGTPKWWDVIVTQLPGQNGDAKFVVISRDITAQRQAAAEERHSHDRLRSILRATTDVLWEIDLATDKVWWSEGISALFGYGPEQVGDTTTWWQEHMHPEDRGRIVNSMAAAVQNGEVTWEGEFRYRKADGSYLDVHDRGSVIRDASGKPVRFSGVMQDVTARKAASARQDLLARELAHRLNNTLAVVSGIFQQTLATSTDMETVAATFGNRIHAMANANSLLVRSGDRGADLEELVNLQLAPYRGGARFSIGGPKAALGLEVSQALALALNELATNAVKYGALTVPEGRVDLTWTGGAATGEETLKIVWQERNGPKIRKPSRTGLGSKLIQHGIPGAKVVQSFAGAGFCCSIELKRR